MAHNPKDEAFAKLVIEMNIVSPSQVRECMNELELRKSKGEDKLNLGIILIQKKLINADDLKSIMEKRKEKKVQKPQLLKCPQCGKAFQVIGYNKDKAYKCNKCGGALYIAKTLESQPKIQNEPACNPQLTDPFAETDGISAEQVNSPLPAAKSPEDELIGRQFGSYIIIKLLGKGGMGKVYLGENPMLNRFAAIKILAQNFAKDQQYLKRFFREAKMAARLQHPNIVTVYDFGQEDEHNYLVLEYVDGETLQNKITREKKLPISEAIKLHIDVLEGLKVAHKQEIVHRDIKPENIMITKECDVKITDMGLARHQDPTQSEALTLDGQALGTPRFMAPEQALGEQIDPRTDLYALGVSIYHSITGDFPYEGRKPVEILKNMLRLDPVPLKQKEATVNQQLNFVVMKLMSKSKDDRYSDAASAIGALKKCLKDYESTSSEDSYCEPESEELINEDDMKLSPPKSVVRIGSTRTKSKNIKEIKLADAKLGKTSRKRPMKAPKTKFKERKQKFEGQKSGKISVVIILILVLLLIALSLIIIFLVAKGPQSSQIDNNNPIIVNLLDSVTF